MTQRQFEDFLKETLQDLDPVPPTPREEMWARIEGQRQFRKQTSRRTHRPLWFMAAGLAAMLAIGIGIGRLTTLTQRPAPTPIAQSQAPSPAQSQAQAAYSLVVAEHMTNADALLTSFRTQSDSALDPQTAAWARDLLTNTRLLLDSPAAADPKVAALLEDLELIIAQIARLTEPSAEEHEIITEGMKKTAVLPRIRATAGT